MAETQNPWQTPQEIGRALGARKSKEVFEDLIYSRRTRREILDLVMQAAGCNEFSAEDFLREVVKSKPG